MLKNKGYNLVTVAECLGRQPYQRVIANYIAVRNVRPTFLYLTFITNNNYRAPGLAAESPALELRDSSISTPSQTHISIPYLLPLNIWTILVIIIKYPSVCML